MERFDGLKDMYGNIQPNYMKEEFIRHHCVKVMDAIDLGESKIPITTQDNSLNAA